MGRKTAHDLLWLALALTAVSGAFAAESALVELEDVSDAEKVQWARATKVDVIDAIKAAQGQAPGKVIEAALHSIKGRLVYEVEVVTKDGQVVEVLVDPQTGRVVERGHP